MSFGRKSEAAVSGTGQCSMLSVPVRQAFAWPVFSPSVGRMEDFVERLIGKGMDDGSEVPAHSLTIGYFDLGDLELPFPLLDLVAHVRKKVLGGAVA